MPPSPPPLLETPLPDLDAWTAWLRDAEIPVLAETAAALEAMRVNEDRVDANGLGEMIANDPLMTLKVLAHASVNRSARTVTDMETVTAAIVMMGIPPFFRAFGPQPTVEARLARHPDALAALLRVLRRAHRAARFALGFSVQRLDPDAPLIHAAALLHDFADMLLWCQAPALATRILEAQRNDPSLDAAAAQARILNVELPDLQRALMSAWRLPALLVRSSDPRLADRPEVRTVLLATRLARHQVDEGWTDPALVDDLDAVGNLLQLAPDAARRLVASIQA